MNDIKHSERKLARKLALENASEFIRSHGEEGGIEQKDFPIDTDVYLQECKKVAKSLQKKADKIILNAQ